MKTHACGGLYIPVHRGAVLYMRYTASTARPARPARSMGTPTAELGAGTGVAAAATEVLSVAVAEDKAPASAPA